MEINYFRRNHILILFLLLIFSWTPIWRIVLQSCWQRTAILYISWLHFHYFWFV